MKDLLGDLTSATWWFGVVFVGVLVNLGAAYLKPRLDSRLSKLSSWWARRSEKLRSARDMRIAKLGSRQDQIFAKQEEMAVRIRSLYSLLLAMFLMVFATWLIEQGYEAAARPTFGFAALAALIFMSDVFQALAIEKEIKEAMEQVPPARAPKSTPSPAKITQYVAAFVLVADSQRSNLRDLLSDFADEAAAALLLDALATDCIEEVASGEKIGGPLRTCWGSKEGKSLKERFEHYRSQDSWMVHELADAKQEKLTRFKHLFEDISDDHPPKLLIPKAEDANKIRSDFPEIDKTAGALMPKDVPR